MKAKNYMLSILLMLLVTVSFAQERSKTRRLDFPRRNSIYLQNHIIFPTLYYDRVIPISNHFGFIPKIGFEHGLGYGNLITFEPTIFFGGNKNYLEVGVGKWVDTRAYIINYRYMADRGFLLKLGFAVGGIDPSLMVGLGYSF